MGGPLRAMLLIALLPFASAKGHTGQHYGNNNQDSCTWTLEESCKADDFCAVKHNNESMKTFRDARICGDPDGELLKTSKWKANGECWTCGRRKGRKLLGGPIPIDTGPIKHGSSRGPCCALKPEECCMPNPYASSGLPYDAARGLIITFNVMFWIYIVLMGL